MMKINGRDQGSVLVELCQELGVHPLAFIRMTRRNVRASDTEESVVEEIKFYDDDTYTTNIGGFHESAPGTALTMELYPYAQDGGGARLEVVYNGGASAKLTVTSPRGDKVVRTLAEDEVAEVNLPVCNGCVLEVSMGDGGNFTITGNPDEAPFAFGAALQEIGGLAQGSFGFTKTLKLKPSLKVR